MTGAPAISRAYSFLTLKSVNEEKRVFTGVATSPEVDRMGDIVEPLGVRFNNPLPLLWQHNHDQPIGTVTFDKPTAKGITFTAELPVIAEDGTLKDRVDEAWQSIKLGLVRAVSIGFRAIEYAFMDDGGIRFSKSEVYELSAVTIPANASATIQTIKSFDTGAPAASGISRPPAVTQPPGASGAKTTATLKTKGKPMAAKTVAEQISAFESSRGIKATRMEELMADAGNAGATFDGQQEDEYDTLASEVKSIDAHIARLRDLEKLQISRATPVAGNTSSEASASRGGIRVEVKGVNLPKGTAFTRYAMALMMGKGNLMQAAEIAKNWKDSTPEVETVIKAAVAAGTTTDATWAKPLVEYQNMASEFAELLRPATIIGRIPGLRRVPFNIKVPRQTAGSTAGWVGEAKPKPVSSLAFDQITLGSTKLAAIVVLSEELVRYSNPSAESVVRQDMINTIVETMDGDFINPTNAGTAGVKPAAITNGVTGVASSGSDADAVRADVKALMTKFVAANLGLAGAVWLMSETLAVSLAMMTNPMGQPEFPGINGKDGGEFFGLPVVLSQKTPAGVMVLAKADEIMLADDGEVMLDVSREASLQMDSAPASPTAADTVLVSLWQHNMVGLRAERYINWIKRRDGAVQMITGAQYG